MKKNYTKITRARLNECLESIGWSTKHMGCGYYYIVNQYGGITNFKFISKTPKDRIYEIALDDKFGDGHVHSNGGSCVFILSGCYLTIDSGAVHITTKAVDKCKHPAFLSFYNFNLK